MKGRAIDMTEKQQASWEERDLAHIWHPCSQMKDYETLPPMVIDHAKGPWLYDIHGKKYLAEKITATFSETGMSQLLKMVAYRIS